MQRSYLTLDEILAKYDWISAFAHPPDLTSLLHDNVAPSPLQTNRLKTSLEGLETPLVGIEGDLDLLHNAVASLEARKLRLQSLKNDYETALSPICRLPSEITMEILCRSRKDNEYREERESQLMKQCFDIMIAHSRRWRAVEMIIHPSYFPRLSHIRGKIDLLRDMYFDCCYYPPSGDFRAFEIAPKLEHLHLKGMHREANILFPASNLVSFSDIRSFAGDQLTLTYLDVVKSAPKLLSFSYNDYGVQSSNIHPVPNPPSPVVASSVEELSASSPSFLRSLILPSLKKVTLTTMYDPVNDMEELEVIKCPAGALGALHRMLLQSQCSLTRLCLVDADLDDNLANVIWLMPELQELAIEFYEWVPDIADDYDPIMQSLVTQLSQFSVVDGSLQHSVIPFLQKLTVRLHTIRYAHVSFINSAFVDMVALRLRQPHDVPHLTELNVRVMGRGWSCALSKESEEALKRMEDEGLRLDFYLDDGDPDTDSDISIW
ncbi:hypothetical protein EDD18DRAFT_1107415 [Armillaria luteobubalina]|uniref:F-box domain-containing protein n=1 Tax=Armillaria luteobubalina TaxID=153913 RepID=A0AA39Q195_9AGAR|nr:hypothetical protein EDD18DRAFT_1107415 [Armillaria luteobubalina]